MTTVHRRSLRSAAPAVAIILLGSLAAACDRSSGSTASPTQNASATEVTLTVTSNAIAGGKNAAEADWYASYVIPKFTEAQKAKGVNVTLKFQPSGVDDEQYKAKLALDLKSKSG
ncbi:MAG: ABC transporter substrate-binding protein, partial [Lapillicoccus sp.]